MNVHPLPVSDYGRSHALRVAHHWAARGIPVFPVAIGWDPNKYRTGGTTKRPLTPHGHRDATINAAQIDLLFSQATPPPGQVIAAGMVTGQAGVITVDIDNKQPGVNGYLCADTLGLPDTYTCRTPSGGEHRFYFKHDPDRPIGNHSPWADRGIDIRANDGFVICPGSETIYGNWVIADDAMQWPHDVATIPAALEHQLAQSRPTTSSGPTAHIGTLTAAVRQALHPDTRRALETLEQYYGAHDPQPAIHEGRTCIYVSRPGKHDGTSASIGFINDGAIYNFSSTWTQTHGLPLETNVWALNDGHLTTDLRRLWAEHTRNTTSAAAPVLEDPTASGPGGPHGLDAYLVNWDELWTKPSSEDWLIEPIVATGRAHAVYAPAKTGKSLFLTYLAAAAATGRAALHKPAGAPINVLYCDLEMTTDDLKDRLQELGYGQDHDLSHFHWLSLPPLELDKADGAQYLVDYAIHKNAQLVIIDTLARAVDGDENSADTYRAFARWTGIGLKRAGIAFVRTDHAGKDLDRGQRGSSAKNDDVDVVWRLTPMDKGGLAVQATHRRMGWVDAEKIVLVRQDDPLRWTISQVGGWPEGTAKLAAQIDGLGCPVSWGRDLIKRRIKEHNDALPLDVGQRSEDHADHISMSSAVLPKAIRYRKERAKEPPE